MDLIKKSFEESDLFKLNANYPDALADAVIANVGDLSEEQKTAIKEGFLEIGFHLTSAARASYRLTHAVDIMRNQGSMGPDVRYIIMEASSELTNAVTMTEPAVRVYDFLGKMGEDLDTWVSEVPMALPDDGLAIEYVRNYKDIVKGRLIYFRYKDIENNTVITDIPCIYDEELFAYMPLTNNPVWKYIDESERTEESSDNTGTAPDADAEKGQGSETD